MKYFLNTILAFVVCLGMTNLNLNAQGIGINETGNAPDPSAILDASSNNKGFLLPRMTTLERNTILNPSDGLQIYNTENDCLEMFFNQGGWLAVRCGCSSFPDATFTGGNGFINNPITFNANGSGTGYTYAWNFPSGTPSTSTAQNPTVEWATDGTYIVELAVTDNSGCSATETNTIDISPCSPPGSQTFVATGSQQTFTVPLCVTEITIDAYGAQGAGYGWQNARTLNLQGATINLTFTCCSPWAVYADNLTLNAGTSTIRLTSTTTSNLTFSNSFWSCGAYDLTYNNLEMVHTSGTRQINSTYSSPTCRVECSFNTVTFNANGNINGENSFSTLNFSANSTYNLQASRTQTITNNINFGGVCFGGVTVQSSNNGTQAIISKTSGVVSGQNLTLRDINATGGATYNAYGSTDNGNNTGWNFAPTPALGTPSTILTTANGYSVAPVTGAVSYTWTMPAGTTILGGQGTYDIQALGAAGEICVTASDGCGSISAPSCLNAVALPVKLVLFEASCATSGDNNVEWQTASEQNSSHFIVERSRDGFNWESVVTVNGAGNTNELKTYTYLDRTAGLNFEGYYRLRQVDFDGTEELFDPISLNCKDTDSPTITVYPNPTSGNFTLRISNMNSAASLSLMICNASGQQVYEKPLDVKSGATSLTFDQGHLEKGVYFIRLMGDNMKLPPQKLIIN